MPLTISLRPGDELCVGDVRVSWVPAAGKGRRIKLAVSGKGHSVWVEKRGDKKGNAKETLPEDVDGNR